jgi:drug/metabolite transporter (DMT)-like permease
MEEMPVAETRGGSERVNYAAGAWYGIASAALFGASAPLAKRLLPQLHPVVLAGILYAGAAFGLSIARLFRLGTKRTHAPFTRRDRLKLAGVIAFGGICGPILLMIGLSRVSGVVGSLLLNLEGVWTALLAVLVFGDRINRREATAIGLVLLAAAIVSFQPGAIAATWPGAAAIAAACLCWGLDNNLMQRLSFSDPVRLVQTKTAVAAPVCLALGLALTQSVQLHARTVVPALLLGMFSYGMSIVFDVYALRHLGAAREAAFFATAPFVGALLSIPILGESLRAADGAAGIMMGIGVLLLVGGADLW